MADVLMAKGQNYDDFTEYPLPLRLVQTNNKEELISMVDSHEDKWSILNCVHSKSGDSPIIVASRHGHLELIKFLIQRGVDIEQRNKDLKRPLHEAAAGGHLDCVKFLISQNAEIDCLKRADWTPLMLSCTRLNFDIIKLLVQSGANLTLTNKDGWNCFHIAAREGQAEFLNYLLDCCSNIWDSHSKNGRTPLHTAALHGRLDAVRLMITRCGYAPDCPDSCGSTPLMDALRTGHVLVAEILVKEHKASLTAKDQLGRQAIHLSAQAGCNKSLEYIIRQRGMDVNVCTGKSKMAPLHLAAKEGHAETVQFLISKGASINTQDKNGRTGKPSPTLDDHRINLQCLQDYMLLDMDLQDIPKLEPTSLHLRHFSCRPQVTNTRAIFQVPFQGCGTTLETEVNHIVYENVVDNSQHTNESRVGVRHAPELYYPFACRYRQKYIITLKEGQKENQENGQEKGNQTREDNPSDVSTNSASSSYYQHFSVLFVGLQLLEMLKQVLH